MKLIISVFTLTSLSLPAYGFNPSQYSPPNLVTSVTTPFNLLTSVTSGSPSFDNLYIAPIHTGAGTYGVLADLYSAEDSSDATLFVLNNTYIDLYSKGGYSVLIYSLGLYPGGNPFILNAADTTNQATNLDAIKGQQTPGFVMSNQKYIGYLGSELPFETFTVCGGLSPDVLPANVPVIQLLWRNTSSTADLEHCADVRLKAVFP